MPENRKLEILSDLLTTAERNFEEAETQTASVDDKAQRTGALAGVLAAFGLAKPESLTALQQRFSSAGPFLLSVDVLLLAGVVLLCVRAMWIRDLPVGGISVAAHEDSARILIELHPDIDDELMAAYRENQLNVWKEALAERHKANTDKTRSLHHAQQALSVAIFVTVCLLGMLVYASLTPTVQSERSAHAQPSAQVPDKDSSQEIAGPRPQRCTDPIPERPPNGDAQCDSPRDRGSIPGRRSGR